MASCLLLGALLLCATTASVLARSPLQQEGSAGAALPASLQPSAASYSTQVSLQSRWRAAGRGREARTLGLAGSRRGSCSRRTCTDANGPANACMCLLLLTMIVLPLPPTPRSLRQRGCSKHTMPCRWRPRRYPLFARSPSLNRAP